MAFSSDFHPPARLQTDEFLIRQLVVADNPLDYEAVMESKEFLRIWEGSAWPEDDFTLEANLADMEKMEKRHNDGETFAYTVMNPTETECLGCLYIAASDFRWYNNLEITELDQVHWTDYELVTQFWIRKSRLADELDRRVVDALGPWFEKEWGMKNLFVTPEAFAQQVAMLESSDLKLRFRLTEPDDDDDASLAFG